MLKCWSWMFGWYFQKFHHDFALPIWSSLFGFFCYSNSTKMWVSDWQRVSFKHLSLYSKTQTFLSFQAKNMLAEYCWKLINEITCTQSNGRYEALFNCYYFSITKRLPILPFNMDQVSKQEKYASYSHLVYSTFDVFS